MHRSLLIMLLNVRSLNNIKSNPTFLILLFIWKSPYILLTQNCSVFYFRIFLLNSIIFIVFVILCNLHTYFQIFLLLILSFCEMIMHTKDGMNYTHPLKKNHKMNTCAHTDKPKKENTKWSLRSAVCLDHNSLSHPRVILNFVIHCFAL